MNGFRRIRILLVIGAVLALSAAAWAEGIFQVNDPGSGNWVFDQPSVVANGTVIHVAFVGDNAAGVGGSPNTRLYYAAVNGSSDFTKTTTTRDHVRLTVPVAIDDDSLYSGARHPQIALRSAKELAILFQAIPAGETGYKLFRALVKIDNNAVTSRRIDKIVDSSGNGISGTDPSFALVTADNTMRVAFASAPSLLAPSSSDVYYARVALDNAAVLDNTLILLTKAASSTGTSPLPRLRLDGNLNSHVVWAADDDATGTPTGIYYAMVKAIPHAVADNLAIGATPVLSGGYRWRFPNVVLATSKNYLWVLAADEPFGSSSGTAGSLGIAWLNPYAVKHDGEPVSVNNLGTNSLFFLNPPGGAVLSSDFDAYRPETWIDPQSRLHVAGYGFRSSLFPYLGTAGRYYAMSLGTTSAGTGTSSVFAGLVSSPVPVGLGDVAFAMQIPGDYTRPAFAHLSRRAIQFWSGPDNVLAGDTGARNLYVTSVLDSPDNAPVTQSGCSIVDDPRRGEAGRIPGAAVLLLPAAFLALRKAARKAFAR
ncbi:MAG: hypothetical protein WC899_01725 [bacterium]|jgi:hypothetical protein